MDTSARNTWGDGSTGSTRRPVTRQRYALRRALVVTVLAGIAVGTVKAVDVIGGDGDAHGAPGVTAAILPDPAGGVVAPVGSAPVPTPAPTAAPTPDSYAGPPSAEHPARVLIAGDSQAGGFAPYLDRLLADVDFVEVTLFYKSSSGLARPDFYNWPVQLEAEIAAVDPDVVIAMFGGNDSQGLAEPCPGGGTDCGPDFIVGDPSSNAEEWTTEYSSRVTEVLDIMGADDRRIIWVGIPNAVSEQTTEDLVVQNDATRQAVAGRDGVSFVDTWNLFSGRSGGFAPYVPDPCTGATQAVRQSDGFHLNETGAEILSVAVFDDLMDAVADLGATTSGITGCSARP